MNSTNEMQGKVALITGAGSGLGKAAAVCLAQAGARIGALSHTAEEVAETVEEIRNKGGEAIELVADVAEPDAMQGAVDKLALTCGGLDIVFANAGINGVWAPLDELDPEEWDKTINVNLRGTFLTVKYAIPHLRRRGGGSIIITSSINGTRVFSNTGATAYSCTKAAQLAFTKMIALELAPDRIRVNVICPGAIKTEIQANTEQRDVAEVKTEVEFPEGDIPLTGGSPGLPEQCADLVYFLASDRSAHITGTPIWIDGGQSLIRG